MTRAATSHFFSALDINPAFLQNMLGRPDYWAPQMRWDEEGDRFLGCDLICQHPRWNLQVQGAPLSVYCKFDTQRDLIVYVISHKPNDTVVQSLRKQLHLLTVHKAQHHVANVMLDSPMDLHTLILNLNFEASKWHVERFRRFQWNAVNDVDNHLAGVEQHDRAKLAQLLKALQIVSQNADSHLANAQVFLHAARSIRNLSSKLHSSKKGRVRQRNLDMLQHLIASMEKQDMWFHNYKGRKDATMNLVFHFNTQTDAMNSIELSADMKRDSTSMSAIAGLTMVFLPGTFVAVSFDANFF